MILKEVYSDYEKMIMDNKKEHIEDYKKIFKTIEESPAKYQGKPVKFLNQPLFFLEEDYRGLKNITDHMVDILNKVIKQYLEDRTFRSYFDFEPLLEKLILKDPGYSVNIPMARFDVFYKSNGDLQFCELNADGSSGMIHARELQEAIGNSLVMGELKKNYNIKGFELVDSWAKALLENYKEFSKGEEKPQIAIVDFLGEAFSSEFEEFKKTFENLGCKTVIADMRDLVYKEGKLYYEDFRIDCIYRRAVTWEVIENQEKVQGFINAYLDGNVCVVGPLRTQLIHNKIIFSILNDPVKTSFLSKEDRSFIEKHIPYTRIFDPKNKEMLKKTIENKDKFVLKPMDKYDSFGVRMGLDHNKDQWLEVINKEAKEEYILQEVCQVPRLPMAIFEKDNVGFQENNYILGLFVYNEKLQGLYTRTGTKNVIGSAVACDTVPNFIISRK